MSNTGHGADAPIHVAGDASARSAIARGTNAGRLLVSGLAPFARVPRLRSHCPLPSPPVLVLVVYLIFTMTLYLLPP